jgi:periplasmic divalent cation tolerance protein
MEQQLLVYTTWPDAETAAAAAAAAVEARLAACANILAPMTSVYRWEGKVERAGETPVLFKTTAARGAELRALLLARHPYDLPCVVALALEAPASNPAFLAWIEAETSGPLPSPADREGSG